MIGTDKEFGMYRYSIQQDGKVNKRLPIKLNDHGMDTTRYIIQSAYNIIPQIVIPPEEIVEREGFWFQEF